VPYWVRVAAGLTQVLEVRGALSEMGIDDLTMGEIVGECTIDLFEAQ